MYCGKNPFETTLNVVYSFDYQIVSNGRITIDLPQPLTVERGQFIMLIQNTGKVAIDKNGNATYSDLTWNTPLWRKLNPNSNLRFYLNAITKFSSYQTALTLSHSYKSIGLYELSIFFTSSNQTYNQIVNVTDCMYYE